jgi:osmotically-inducible protein OsmY
MDMQEHEEPAGRLDRDIQRDVVAEIDWDPRIQTSEIGVTSRNGIVTLTGSVEAFGQRWAAEEAAHRVRGVRAVANEIDVRLPVSSERTDSEIAAAAVHALGAHAGLRAEDIAVTVSDGMVLLKGAVDLDYQKQDAEQAVRDLWGVRGVTNLLASRDRSNRGSA